MLLAVDHRHPAGTCYQLWVGWTWQVPDRVAHAVIGTSTGAPPTTRCPTSTSPRLLLEAIDEGRDFGGGVRATARAGRRHRHRGEGLVIGAEQSNTSIVYGHSAILKVFRRLEPGPNPDAEIHRALHAVGFHAHRAAVRRDRRPAVDRRRAGTTLALLTEFFANSAEGWAMATSSVRDLMSEGDLRADEVGGDFAAEAYRLGEAVAAVHADLARAFGTNIAPARRAGPDPGRDARRGERGGRPGARRWPSTATAIMAAFDRAVATTRPGSTCSGSTATCTSVRCCAR